MKFSYKNQNYAPFLYDQKPVNSMASAIRAHNEAAYKNKMAVREILFK